MAAAPPARSASTTWQLNVRFHDPQRISMTLPGQLAPKTFWYLLYEVVNDTGDDRTFFPSSRLVTDTLEVVEGGANTPTAVYDTIIARHRKTHPFLAPPAKVTGTLRQGRANARASMAVFSDFDPAANSFTIYAAGFSGEIKRIPNPAFDSAAKESLENARSVIIRRTLAIRYDLPGDAQTRRRASPVRTTKEWIMR